MIKLKDILTEEVPFDKSQQIKAGLEKKYGTEELSAYTFGIELEFQPKDISLDSNKLRIKLINSETVIYKYDSWLIKQRKDSNLGVSSVEHWDGIYGPIDIVTFDELEPKPEKSNYSDIEEYENTLNDWKEKRIAVEKEYHRFKNRNYDGYLEQYIQELITSGDWESYVDFDDISNFKEKDEEVNIADTMSYIENSMGEKVQYGDNTADTWGVGPDGSNIEIRSKHLNQNEFNLVKLISDYVKDKKISGGTSAHVHIGLPKDFDAFDLLTITTLVDEKAIQQTVGPLRRLETWANLRTDLNNTIVNALIKSTQNQSTNEKSFVLTNQQLFKILNQIGRYWGTNVASMSKLGTIEFRYLSSEVTQNPDSFIKWIKYYLLLPKVAKSRNTVILKQSIGSDSQSVTAIRQFDSVKFVLNNSGSTLNLPAAALKTGQIPVSPKFTQAKKQKELSKIQI